MNSVLRSSPKNKKVNQTKRDSRERKPIDKIMTTDLVDALGLRKNSTKDQILEEVRNFRKLAAEADVQKK